MHLPGLWSLWLHQTCKWPALANKGDRRACRERETAGTWHSRSGHAQIRTNSAREIFRKIARLQAAAATVLGHQQQTFAGDSNKQANRQIDKAHTQLMKLAKQELRPFGRCMQGMRSSSSFSELEFRVTPEDH